MPTPYLDITSMSKCRRVSITSKNKLYDTKIRTIHINTTEAKPSYRFLVSVFWIHVFDYHIAIFQNWICFEVAKITFNFENTTLNSIKTAYSIFLRYRKSTQKHLVSPSLFRLWLYLLFNRPTRFICNAVYQSIFSSESIFIMYCWWNKK